jgi:hypothetical protein
MFPQVKSHQLLLENHQRRRHRHLLRHRHRHRLLKFHNYQRFLL